jgi:hypothetical protein
MAVLIGDLGINRTAIGSMGCDAFFACVVFFVCECIALAGVEAV